MIILRLFCGYFVVILWLFCMVILGYFVIILCLFLGSFEVNWVIFGVPLFLGIYTSVMYGLFWVHFGLRLDIFFGYFGFILGVLCSTFWYFFETFFYS